MLDLSGNQLSCLPDSIGNLTNLTELYLNYNFNQLSSLPDSIVNLSNLTYLGLNDNYLTDLSVLANVPKLKNVSLFGVNLHRRYWTEFSDWKAEWLLDEDNAEVRRTLIEQIGYDKIRDELDANTIDTWREYTLLKIDGVTTYDKEYEEPMVLLKMTCPSTAHIHILRVPPEMVSAEAAITWVNQGIHPDEFTVQT